MQEGISRALNELHGERKIGEAVKTSITRSTDQVQVAISDRVGVRAAIKKFLRGAATPAPSAPL